MKGWGRERRERASKSRAVRHEAWQCCAADSGCLGGLRFNSQWRQSGLQRRDLLAELCSKPQQPGLGERAGEAVACTLQATVPVSRGGCLNQGRGGSRPHHSC